MTKTFVNIHNNKKPQFLQNHFKVGDKVIVVDGSYMTDKDGNNVHGIDFRNNQREHELLTIVRVNVPFKTNYEYTSDTLGYHNNCEIEGTDGKRYNCSKINILGFEL
jgi:hypothetical protein